MSNIFFKIYHFLSFDLDDINLIGKFCLYDETQLGENGVYNFEGKNFRI